MGKNGKSGRKRALYLTITLLFLLGYCLFQSGRSRDVLLASKLVAAKPEWNKYDSERWLDSRYLIVKHNEAPANSEGFVWALWVYDTQLHQFRKMEKVSQRIKETGGLPPTVSADGKWVSWDTETGGKGHDEQSAPKSHELLSVDGTTSWSLSIHNNSETSAWAETGDDFVRFVSHFEKKNADDSGYTPFEIRQFTAIEIWRLIPGGSGKRQLARTIPIPAKAAINQNSFYDDALACTTNGTLVVNDISIAYTSGHRREDCDILVYSLRESALREKVYSVSLPRHLQVYSATTSHDGRSILWQIEQDHFNSALAWLHRYLKFVPDNHNVHLALWVSGGDGSNMHEVGHIDRTADVNGYPRLQEILWLPNDKTISFKYNGELRTLDVQ